MNRNPFEYSVATRVREPHFEKLLASVDKSNLLDIGCGMGYFSDYFSRRGASVYGVDPDLASIKFSSSHSKAPYFLVGDAQSLPFKANSFDIILCSEVLEHIKDHEKAISEISRVGKAGATAIISVPSPEGIFGSRIKNIAHDHEEGFEHHYRGGYKERELKKLLEKCGIRITRVRYSMIFLTEIVMGLTKLAYLSKSKSLNTQVDTIEVKELFLFKLWKLVFPFILMLCKLEDRLLPKRLKGHMLIIKGTINKKAPST